MSGKRVFKIGTALLLISLFFSVWLGGKKAGTALVEGAGSAVTHATSGVVEADTLIGVRFRDDQVGENAVGEELRQSPFKFSPRIPGKAYWADRRTLAFQPDKPLYEKRHYHAVLDLAYGAEKFNFEFSTRGQKIVGWEGGFQSAGRFEAYFYAKVVFREKVSEEAFFEALSLKIDGETLEGRIKTDDQKTFHITTENIKRPKDSPQSLQLSLKGGPLGLGEDVQEDYRLAVQDAALHVVRIEEFREKDASRLRITFSDKLGSQPNYRGYFNVEPDVFCEAYAEDNYLVIVGNFQPGETYNIELFPGVYGALGQKLAESSEYLWEVEIGDVKPAVEFLTEGLFLPTGAEKSIRFRTMNVEKLRLQVKKVEEENLIAFFEENSYRGDSGYFYNYNRYGFLRLGEIIEDRYVTIGSEPNQWVVSELDLSSTIKEVDSALYIIQLDFEETHALYFPENMEQWEIADLVYERGRAIQHLLVSDVGITAKEIEGDLHVYLTDLLTTENLVEASVLLKTKEGRILARGYTDEAGKVTLKQHREGRYVEVHSGDKFGILDLRSSRLNQSVFAIGGTLSQRGINAFIYTERGAYRPGDEINLSAIIRNEDNTFPKDHPAVLKVYNPQGQLQHELTAASAVDGFYSFKFATKSTDPTGDWRGVLEVGGREFPHYLKVEEIVPHRIRVEIETAEEIEAAQKDLEFGIAAEYLFGAPAGNLRCETEVFLESQAVSFADYPDFSFENATAGFFEASQLFEEVLDEKGRAKFKWRLPQVKGLSSGLSLRLAARVYESGGRPVLQTKTIPVKYYPAFVGIEKLASADLELGSTAGFSVLHLDYEGKPLKNSELEYAIYRLERYWWWEYDSQASFRRYFKANQNLIKEGEGVITTNDLGTAQIEHQLTGRGEMVLEVKDPQGGHSAAYFFRSWWWGDSQKAASPGVLSLKLDKEEYAPGDLAALALNAPAGSRALITVEKEGSILHQAWEDIKKADSLFELEVKEEYMPNAYVSVLVIQPYGARENDLPLRLHGILPLMVAGPATKLGLSLEMPASIRPQEDFTLKVQTDDGKPAQFTVAVVDEGLLNITGFQTPDPWNHFFAKQRLLTVTYDNFSDIIDPVYGYIHNLFTVGGGLEADYRKMQVPDDDTKRFEPVSLFAGPLTTDENGSAEIRLTMPNYIGAVKVMVVAASGGRYGSGEKTLPVKAPVMVMPTLPRLLRPLDSIKIPVTVFALEDNVGDVAVRLDLKGPVQFRGPKELSLNFEEVGSKEVYFYVKAGEEVGAAHVNIAAEAADGFKNYTEVTLPIRPANPYIYLGTEKTVQPGEMVEFLIPPAGVSGTGYSQLSVSSLRGLNISHRLRWLTRYPYLCVEQITSGAFPQLYYPKILPLSREELRKIDENINGTIQDLRNYRLRDGGFAYWPGGGAAHLWATNYAGHFLLEAKAHGYHVPADLLAGWLDFQSKAARANLGDRLTRVYRLYLLTLAEKPAISALNYMRESELNHLGDLEKHLLAASYQILGYDDITGEILKEAGLRTDSYQRYPGTFGSKLRDQAFLLDTLMVLGDFKAGSGLYDEIAAAISANEWYSTQSTGFALLALSKYAEALAAKAPVLSGVVLLENQKPLEIEHKGAAAAIPLEAVGGETLVFQNTSAVPLFATLEWEGIPKPEDLAPEQKKLTLEIKYFAEAGTGLNPKRLQQGTPFYALFRVGQEEAEDLSELALVQALPAGWEIENLRLLGGELPAWTEKYNLNRENYVDIRDDRIMWFFDMAGWVETYDFIVKLNAVTVGEFTAPPALLEAMYDNDYKVVGESGTVEVAPR